MMAAEKQVAAEVASISAITTSMMAGGMRMPSVPADAMVPMASRLS
jgi:hypothetical protein